MYPKIYTFLLSMGIGLSVCAQIITFNYDVAGNTLQKQDDIDPIYLQERLYLDTIYQELAGVNWSRKDNWLDDCDHCEWYGIICDAQKRVTAIELPNNQLVGQLIGVVTQLSLLQKLDLAGNQLAGELPANWCNLTNLNTLHLQNNQLTGCYPECFNTFCTLEADFSQNADLSDFTTFCADNSQSCPCVPTHQSEYDALVTLYETTDGANWKDNTNWLADCDYCNWEGITCDGMGRVTIINLSSNNLIGNFPAELGNLPQLQQLRMRSNQLSGAITFTNPLVNLYRLDLSSNNFMGNLPDLLTVSPNVSFLYLSSNNFTGSISESYCSFDFSVIYLDRNDLSGCLPACLSNFCDANVRMANNPQLPDGGNFSTFCQQQTGVCTCISDYSAVNGNRLTGLQQTSKTFSSEYTIESVQTIAATTNVIYTAGESITLEAGFNVEAGAIFTATIGGCTNDTDLQSDTIQMRFADKNNTSVSKVTDDYFLGQNHPNPFQQTTTISYQLPNHANQAELRISDYLGRSAHIKKIRINEDTVQLDFTENKVGGLYFYSLIIDGEIVATKRMILVTE